MTGQARLSASATVDEVPGGLDETNVLFEARPCVSRDKRSRLRSAIRRVPGEN